MNFVGHAMVARWERRDAAFAFGAMLPDLQRMCGNRLDGVDDPSIADGVAHHHRVDSIFHDTPTFEALCTRARGQLRALGLPRPVVLAAAHVGIELLLDGAFCREPGVVAHYLAAIDAGVARADTIRWRAHAEAPRFTALCTRLGTPAAARGYTSPTTVSQRLMRVLSTRKALAPAPEHAPALRRWATRTAPHVDAHAAQLQTELRARL